MIQFCGLHCSGRHFLIAAAKEAKKGHFSGFTQVKIFMFEIMHRFTLEPKREGNIEHPLIT